MKRKSMTFILCVLLMMGLLGGCSAVETVSQLSPGAEKEIKTVLTIGGETVTEPEAYVYLYLMQKPYETYYGAGLWQTQYSEGVTWREWLLDEVRRQIVEIEILCQRAEKEGLALTDEARAEAKQGAEAMMATLDDDTAGTYGLTEACITKVYEKSMLAGLYYQSVLDGYETALSDEEAAGCEAIDICQIFISTEDTAHLSEGQDQEQLAEELRKRAEDGEDFETLAKAYSSENTQIELIFDREGYVFDTDAWLEESFIKAAWELEAGQISAVIQTSYGYHVLKCAAVNSDSLKAQAQENKLNEKKKAAFLAEYEAWLADTVCTGEDTWQEMRIMEGI